MNIFVILIIILIILFFSVFLYYLFTENNEIIKYRVIKDPIESEINLNIFKDINNDKYNHKKCDKMCNLELCDDYHSQLIKYDLCKECKSEGKCYDEYRGLCVRCTNNNTCEELFGCNDVPPINPTENLCTRCWNINSVLTD